MKEKEVIVLNADNDQSRNMLSFLRDNAYSAILINSIAHMNQYIAEKDCRAVVMNLDNIAVTNKALRDLKRKRPLISIIALSKRQFHPELEESFREYITVCLADPVDTDELNYWLKSVFENNS